MQSSQLLRCCATSEPLAQPPTQLVRQSHGQRIPTIRMVSVCCNRLHSGKPNASSTAVPGALQRLPSLSTLSIPVSRPLRPRRESIAGVLMTLVLTVSSMYVSSIEPASSQIQVHTEEGDPDPSPHPIPSHPIPSYPQPTNLLPSPPISRLTFALKIRKKGILDPVPRRCTHTHPAALCSTARCSGLAPRGTRYQHR
ncbi:hypothetical protein BDW22DRAFT_974685 [Trametopsis cervina]|nr:hypothetical protein BDW22DRAFT_974685 [Trametopsis cervina]